MKKKLSTRIFSIFLSLLMVVSILPAGAITAQAAPNGVSQKLNSLRTVYPNGRYWNHYVSNYSEAVDNLNKWDNKFSKTTTNHPCNAHGIHNSTGLYDCNAFQGGQQCWGFANRIFYDVFGQCATSLSLRTDINNISVGDWVRFVEWGDKGHSAIVLSRNGNSITLAECNFGYTCQISWGRTVSLYSVIGFYHASNYNNINNQYSTEVPMPVTPKISADKSENVAAGSVVKISWPKDSNARTYTTRINGKIVGTDSFNWYNLIVEADKKYEIDVRANGSYGNSGWSNKVTITAHNPSKVIFKDYDGTILNEQTVNYGSSATVPTPVREGYTFTGWDKSYSNIKTDTVITAQYKINTYTVKFLDMKGDLLDSKKVEYGSAAPEPEDKRIPAGYAFLGWDTQDYKTVKSNLTVRGIYAWGNNDLPIVVTNMKAQRQDDGYYVYFDLTNYPDAVTRGRAVVSLKTADGKLVDATESAAFSIPKDGIKTGMEVFIPCEKTATVAEVEIVNSYSSGVPISQSVTTSVDQGTKWSDWQDEDPGEQLEVQTRTEYRYRDKQFTSSTATNTMAGWTLYNTTSEWSDYGPWSSWSRTKYTASDSRQVNSRNISAKTHTEYHYFRYYNSSTTGSYNYQASGTQYQERWSKTPYIHYEGVVYYPSGTNGNYSSNWWFQHSNFTKTVTDQAAYTEYCYRDRNLINRYHFYKWNDWSNWSAEKPSENDNREIEQKTVYRYVGGSEDTSGQTRITSGKLDSSYAGKQATLFVYKVDEVSDYSNEYVGQTTIADDGSYSFTYKLREEPTVKTGDFTIALGIEGTNNTMVIGTIEAPKPTYTVKFLSKDGVTVLDTQTVVEGESAIVPDVPEVEGYTFTGWSENTTNIKEDVEITAQYKENTYTVVFVDWVQENISVREFTYGSVITPPDCEKIEGYEFSSWEGITEDTVATQNMIVTAKYDKETYTVKFFDFDGNVINTQTVEYKSAAKEPEIDVDDNKEFLGWRNDENNGDYTEVKEDMNLYPQYVFKETTVAPTADIASGEYTSAQKVTLTSATEDAVIYYTTDGSDPSDIRTAKMYTEPITISKSCVLKYVACSFEKNDSAVSTNYYYINNPSVKSEWMLYSQLPDDVKNNSDDYNIESETGYRYKNVQKTSKTAEASKLLTDGWILNGTSYTEYSDWQNEEIVEDNTYLDLIIDIQYVKDTASGTKYRYSHYKYTDNSGKIQYSPTAVSGYDCTFETVVPDTKLSIAGFTDDNVSYYNYDSQQWFNQERVSAQYRSKYQVAEYYRWTDWGIDAPSADETREYETDTIYRYSNNIYHLVTLNNIGYGSETLIIKDNTKLDVSVYDNLYGYNFTGLYLDPEFSNEFDLSAPVTESLTLYAKYTPKSYNVLFQMEDGTELDMQTVKYLQSATAPDTDVVPGYVFGGWDKEFDCITEDTVITGKYFKESEYTRVALSKSNATLVTGSTFNLTASITPENLTDEEIEWSSSDPSVATVDENGKVTAISQGTAVITCIAVKTKEYASCTVKVLADDSNFIILSTDSSLNYDSLGYLRRIALKTSVETASKEFTNDNLKFFNISGTELTSTDYIGTGTQVKLFNGSNAVDTKTVVVTGDMTGDGIINNRDVAMMNKKLIDKAAAQECQMLAIDVNGDGHVNNKDAAMVARYLVGKDAF